MARDLGDGGGDAVRADLQNGLSDVLRHKCEPVGAHDARPFILHGCDLVGGDVKVPGVDGGERGDVHLKLHLVGPPERRVEREVERGRLDQRQEPVYRDLPLHRPEIDRPLLVFSFRDAEEGVEDGNEAILIDRE